MCGKLDRVALYINTAARCGDGTGRFDGNIYMNVLSGADAAQDAAEWLDRKPCGVSSSPCSLPRCVTLLKPAPISTTFDSIDAHHGIGNFCIEAAKTGSPKPTGTLAASI